MTDLEVSSFSIASDLPCFCQYPTTVAIQLHLSIYFGSSLSTMTTAATWYHRFYMRNSIEEYPKQV